MQFICMQTQQRNWSKRSSNCPASPIVWPMHRPMSKIPCFPDGVSFNTPHSRQLSHFYQKIHSNFPCRFRFAIEIFGQRIEFVRFDQIQCVHQWAGWDPCLCHRRGTQQCQRWKSIHARNRRKQQNHHENGLQKWDLKCVRGPEQAGITEPY